MSPRRKPETKENPGPCMEQRTVTMRVLTSDREGLCAHAATAARFANELLTERYIEAKRYCDAIATLTPEERAALTKEEKQQFTLSSKVGLAIYKRHADHLSSSVRDAMRQEVEAVWGKYVRAILAGHRSLPIFSSERSLCVRDRGVKVQAVGDAFEIHLHVLPEHAGWLVLPVYQFTEKKSLYLTDWLTQAAQGLVKLTKASIRLNPRKPQKLLARITYAKPSTHDQEGPSKPSLKAVARIGAVGEHGELYLRVDGPAYTYKDWRRLASMTADVQRMQAMKQHIEGIWHRVRLSKKRKAMRKLRRFEEWAQGPSHQLSRAIVNFCVERGVTMLEWRIAHDGTLPWHQIHQQVVYKGREHGMQVVQERPLLEQSPKEVEQWTRQAKQALRALGQATRKM